MSYHLFLDDERLPRQVTWIELPLLPWTIVRSYEDFVAIIKKNGLPATVTFDHDLSLEHYDAAKIAMRDRTLILSPKVYDYDKFLSKTGYHAAKWLVEYCLDNNLDLPRYFTHSMNPVGCDNINALFESYTRSRLTGVSGSGFLGTPGKQEQAENSSQSEQIHK